MLPQDRTGVYLIRNVLDGTIYVGSTTKSFHVRCQGHFHALRAGKHNNRHLQAAFKKYGEDAFVFIIWEFADDVRDILACEQYWMDWYRANGRVYNILPRAGTTKGQIGHPFNDEQKRRMSEKLTGRKLPREHKENIAAFWTTEERIAQSERKKGKKFKDTTKMSAARRGNTNARGNSKKIEGGFIAPDGTHHTEVGNLADFCREHELIPTLMRRVYRGLAPHHKGWRKA